jgi:hypothetical protein
VEWAPWNGINFCFCRKKGLSRLPGNPIGQTVKRLGFGEIEVWKPRYAQRNPMHLIGSFVFPAYGTGREKFCALGSRYALSNALDFVGHVAAFKRWFLQNQGVSEFSPWGFQVTFESLIFRYWKNSFRFSYTPDCVFIISIHNCFFPKFLRWVDSERLQVCGLLSYIEKKKLWWSL